MKITIIDYRLGNLHSVLGAIRKVGYDALITNKISDILASDKIILPGVGAFADGMKNIKDLNPSDFCHGQAQDTINYGYSDNYPLENLKNNKIDSTNSKAHINSIQHDLINYLSGDNKKYVVDLNNDNEVNFDTYWDPNNLQNDKVEFKRSRRKKSCSHSKIQNQIFQIFNHQNVYHYKKKQMI